MPGKFSAYLASSFLSRGNHTGSFSCTGRTEEYAAGAACAPRDGYSILSASGSQKTDHRSMPLFFILIRLQFHGLSLSALIDQHDLH